MEMIGAHGNAGVGIWLAATTLACRQLEVDSSGLHVLLRATQSEIDNRSLDAAQAAVKEAMSPLDVAASAAEKLKAVPPMVRAVVSDWFSRDWGRGKLRFELYYDNRAYGCAPKWNQQYVEWMGFFGPPDDNVAIPASITKDVLQTALGSRGIAFRKSDPRKTLIEQAKQVPGLIASLVASSCPELQMLCPEWLEPVSKWADRARIVQPVAAAMLQFFGLTAIDH